MDELETMFPGRHFTPDGHMVGSLGEALASYHYGIELAVASAACHDGICDGRQIQIKTTQGNCIALSDPPEHLLVLQLKRDGNFDSVYNGPGERVWALVKDRPPPKNGQYQLSLSKVRELLKGIKKSESLPLIHKS